MSKAKGGLALPCLKSYYQAAQIKPLLNLCNPSYSARWKEIELKRSTEAPIQAFIGNNKLRHQSENIPNPWIDISLKVWFEIVTKNNLTHNNKLLRWIGYDTEFSPNRRDSRFKNWEQGPHMFWELLENKKCKSFKSRFL